MVSIPGDEDLDPMPNIPDDDGLKLVTMSDDGNLRTVSEDGPRAPPLLLMDVVAPTYMSEGKAKSHRISHRKSCSI